MKVHCIGCSWTQNWPQYMVCERKWTALDGSGLVRIGNELHAADWTDSVVVQLPTPIRSFGNQHDLSGVTRDLFINFWASLPRVGLGMANSMLITQYRKEIEAIHAKRPGITFFEFNTAGYPFRHCHDFGETCSDSMAAWATSKGIDWLRLDLAGQPGMTRREVAADTPVETDEPTGWSVISPPGLRVIDGHPSMEAEKLAAVAVEKHLCGG